MAYILPRDGDAHEIDAWGLFLQLEFPSYEKFWLKHVIPLTNRPVDIHFRNDAALTASGHTHEDLAIAQLHYTVLKHLLSANRIRQTQNIDELALFVGLSCLCGAQDVAFEVLERYTNRGKYDPWAEKRTKGGTPSGQDAQSAWKKVDGYPLQDVRDYRNKLIHGRTPPAIFSGGRVFLPSTAKVDSYGDWRLVTDPVKSASAPASDFEYCGTIMNASWRATLEYLEASWQKHLLP